MELGSIAIRCVFAYVFLVAMLRLRGKSAVSEATAFDFVLALIVGDMIDDAIWAEVPLAQFVAGIGALIVTDTLLSLAGYLNSRIHDLINGSSRRLIRHGRRDRGAMRREQLPDSELDAFLRIDQIPRDEETEVADGALERDGQLSVIREGWAREVQKRDLEQWKPEER